MLCSRRQFLATAGLAVAAQPARKWNFVFVLADDLGWADLPVNGGDLHETPEIDAFAKTATRFTQAYAAAPICSPTRASILTGKSPARLGITIWHEGALEKVTNKPLIPAVSEDHLPHSEVTLAEKFHEAGYRTHHIGKWHLGTTAHAPETQGFDSNTGGTHWGAPKTYFYPYKGMQANGEFRFIPGLEPGQPGDYLTDALTSAALRTIDACGSSPFFLNLWYHNPHTPIEAKPVLTEYFEKKLRPGLQHQNAKYAAMIRTLSENFGRLLTHLEQRGLAANTVIVFFSDNGGYTQKNGGQTVTTNAPLRSGKGSLYEGGIRVPLLIRWPGVTRGGSVCTAPVISCDFFSTLLEIAGIPAEPHDGVSLVPLPPRDLFFHYPHYYPTTTPVSMIRSGDWKLLEYFEGNRLELFNLKSDPGESHDLAQAEPARTRQLHENLKQWRQSVNARLPVRNRAVATQ
jgi:arylsulfatase A-like enzyme